MCPHLERSVRRNKGEKFGILLVMHGTSLDRYEAVLDAPISSKFSLPST
ncbi:hypothetical protein PRO82_001868 [Candidatus Protochlamydia amoebophila]|nr:hypothetical protein [Candidatus Protochlamydia amoebophila]